MFNSANDAPHLYAGAAPRPASKQRRELGRLTHVEPGDTKFSAASFLEDLSHGKYDDHLNDELRKLTPEELGEVLALMAKHMETRGRSIEMRGRDAG